jgi:uncharacterized protein (DUF697 family)
MADAVAERIDDREVQAKRIVNYYLKWAAGMGLIPVPVLDVAAVTGVQLKMLRRLAKVYGVDYEESSGKSLVAALLASIIPARIGYGSIGSLVKAIPAVGTIAGMITVPAFNYASTYALGKVFRQHFATGGTLLDFDPDKMRGHFAEEFKNAPKEPKKTA